MGPRLPGFFPFGIKYYARAEKRNRSISKRSCGEIDAREIGKYKIVAVGKITGDLFYVTHVLIVPTGQSRRFPR